MKFYINFSVLLFFMTLNTNVVLAESDYPLYSSKNPLAPEIIFKECDLYIKERVPAIFIFLTEMENVYNSKDWRKLKSLLIESDLDSLVAKLRWCVGVFEFKGQRDYFYYAYKDLLLLQNIYLYAINEKEASNDNVFEISKGVKKDLNKIKIARRKNI